MSKYFVYVIKCEETNRFYVGKSTSKSKWYNPCKYFKEKYDEDNSKYTELGKSFDKYGINKHKVSVLNNRKTYDIEEAEKKVYEIYQQLGDRSLNGEMVKPERTDCPECGKRIKKIYVQDHLDKYCEKQIEKDLLELLSI